jgi:hypothetical protein
MGFGSPQPFVPLYAVVLGKGGHIFMNITEAHKCVGVGLKKNEVRNSKCGIHGDSRQTAQNKNVVLGKGGHIFMNIICIFALWLVSYHLFVCVDISGNPTRKGEYTITGNGKDKARGSDDGNCGVLRSKSLRRGSRQGRPYLHEYHLHFRSMAGKLSSVCVRGYTITGNGKDKARGSDDGNCGVLRSKVSCEISTHTNR